MKTTTLKHQGQTLPMQGVTFASVIRYLLDHDPGLTRGVALSYFAPADRDDAGAEYDRAETLRRLRACPDQDSQTGFTNQDLLGIARIDSEKVRETIARATAS